MIKSSIEKMADAIGFDIGMSDDTVQADLLNGFCRALRSSMDEHNRGIQLAYIVDELTSESRRILLELAEFISLVNKER